MRRELNRDDTFDIMKKNSTLNLIRYDNEINRTIVKINCVTIKKAEELARNYANHMISELVGCLIKRLNYPDISDKQLKARLHFLRAQTCYDHKPSLELLALIVNPINTNIPTTLAKRISSLAETKNINDGIRERAQNKIRKRIMSRVVYALLFNDDKLERIVIKREQMKKPLFKYNDILKVPSEINNKEVLQKDWRYIKLVIKNNKAFGLVKKGDKHLEIPITLLLRNNPEYYRGC